jgi:hypothetical protein
MSDDRGRMGAALADHRFEVRAGLAPREGLLKLRGD